MKFGVTEKLISYASENPQALDTAAGIARWWIKMPLETVLPALESLVALGIWEKISRDDQVLYGPIPDSVLNGK